MLTESKAFGGFSVSDLEKSKVFYRDILGLEVSSPMEQLAELHIEGGNKVILYFKPDHIPATFTVLNFPVKNLENTMEELRNRGVKFEIYKEAGFETDENGILKDQGMKIAWFKDPSGNILSVLEDQK